MKKKLLIICRSQFGFHIDTFYYCKYLRTDFDVTYLCWDYELPYQNLNDVHVKYISRKGGMLRRYFRFLWQAIREVNNGHDLCFLKYFPGCSILKAVYPRKKYVFDVRTGYVNTSNMVRAIHDNFLWLESLIFPNITVISKCLGQRLRLRPERTHILPLGSEIISSKNKKFQSIGLLYVGTLENRNIEDTVIGFQHFYGKHGAKLKMNYEIVGTGPRGEEDELRKMIQEMGLTKLVHLHGYVPHNSIQTFFDKNNIGVSYIPMTDYFDCQPPTKTFEYALSGMAVIGTATSENKSITNKRSGVLINATPDGFCEGLEKIYKLMDRYDSEEIRNTCTKYLWKNIVRNNLKPYLQGL